MALIPKLGLEISLKEFATTAKKIAYLFEVEVLH